MSNIILDSNGEEIKFRPIKYSLKDIATILEVNDSAIRFWSKEFKEFLDVDQTTWKKEYTDRDLYVFKFIKSSVRDSKNSIEATYNELELDYPRILRIEFNTDMTIEEKDASDVAINTIVDNRIGARLNDFKEEFKVELVEEVSNAVEVKMQNVLMKHFAGIEDLIKENQELNNKKLDEIKSEIAITVVEEVSGTVKEGIENSSKTINETLTRIEEATKERDLKQAEGMKKILDQRRKENEELIASMKANEEKKGFFSRMFGK